MVRCTPLDPLKAPTWLLFLWTPSLHPSPFLPTPDIPAQDLHPQGRCEGLLLVPQGPPAP